MSDNWADPAAARALLASRLAEPPGRLELLAGPRQVGKTTLLLGLAREFGDAACYVAWDDPAMALPGAWDRLWNEAEARANAGPAVLLLDEIHYLPDWARPLKVRWDRLRRHGISVHVVATGSSALRVSPIRCHGTRRRGPPSGRGGGRLGLVSDESTARSRTTFERVVELTLVATSRSPAA